RFRSKPRAQMLDPAEDGLAPKHRLVTTKPDKPVSELAQLGVLRAPVVPGELVVLAPSVVVAELRASDLISAQQHRRALGEQQRCQEVALLLGAQHEHLAIG